MKSITEIKAGEGKVLHKAVKKKKSLISEIRPLLDEIQYLCVRIHQLNAELEKKLK